jgi:hypothetical protein
MWTVDWDGGFVVGGDGNRRLTPSFRLKEFTKPDGTVRVHRELVSGLQLLRDRFGSSLAVKATDAGGLAAVVAGEPADALLTAAEALRDRRVFESVARDASGVRVRIPDPDSLPAVPLDQALETALAVTAAFETAGDKFQQITGNFDGAGLSFGPAQVNFGSGTLVPLFKKFIAADEAAVRACFTDPDDWEEWLRVMAMPEEQQIQWANSISTGRGGHDVVEPWKGYFRAVGRVLRFREIMVESMLSDYGGKMMRALKKLRGLKPEIGIDHLRCICSLYDLVVQQGSLDKAWDEIVARVARDNPRDQFELVRIAVEERGRKASTAWRDDACSRRLGILQGVPETVGERQRANINFYMLRDVRISNVGDLASGEVTDEFARLSETLGAGKTLLA